MELYGYMETFNDLPSYCSACLFRTKEQAEAFYWRMKEHRPDEIVSGDMTIKEYRLEDEDE